MCKVQKTMPQRCLVSVEPNQCGIKFPDMRSKGNDKETMAHFFNRISYVNCSEASDLHSAAVTMVGKKPNEVTTTAAMETTGIQWLDRDGEVTF